MSEKNIGIPHKLKKKCSICGCDLFKSNDPDGGITENYIDIAGNGDLICMNCYMKKIYEN